MVVHPVDDRDIDVGTAKRLGGSDAAESAADDRHSTPGRGAAVTRHVRAPAEIAAARALQPVIAQAADQRSGPAPPPITSDRMNRSPADLRQSVRKDDPRGGLDRGEVREGLGKVAEVPAAFRVELLGVQPKW